MPEKSQLMPLKEWRIAQAQRENVSESAINMRINRGKYPCLVRRYLNHRIVLVDLAASADWTGLGPWTEEVKP